ncbi:MAG: monofunctional biosynthetic peptidoglycan transglycosylase [Alphaproteobacteria bacterium]|nr:monofunctional biosynthetic peptidoglycan transglycosylase [Alphaproteobacteria bacterium]
MVAVVIVLIAPIALTFAYKEVAPPVTPLMVIRVFEGEGIAKKWVPIERISPNVIRAVIALEDTRFCQHDGVDWDSVQEAVADHLKGARLRGASTISMQTAKNLFLWPGRNFLRKAIEAPLTYLLEWQLGKRRILEIYLNVVEWGPGIYGVEAAAQRYFDKPASALTPWQSGLLAAILPNPRRWSPIRPTDYIRSRARTAMARSNAVAPRLRCLRGNA